MSGSHQARRSPPHSHSTRISIKHHARDTFTNHSWTRFWGDVAFVTDLVRRDRTANGAVHPSITIQNPHARVWIIDLCQVPSCDGAGVEPHCAHRIHSPPRRQRGWDEARACGPSLSPRVWMAPLGVHRMTKRGPHQVPIDHCHHAESRLVLGFGSHKTGGNGLGGRQPKTLGAFQWFAYRSEGKPLEPRSRSQAPTALAKPDPGGRFGPESAANAVRCAIRQSRTQLHSDRSKAHAQRRLR